MRPQGMRPKFDGQGKHRPNSSNQRGPRLQFLRPPFPTSPRNSRGNGNRNGRLPGPYGPMAGPNVQMIGPNGPIMGPNGPMLGPNGPMITPSGPAMCPNGPIMGPNGPMVVQNRPMMRPNGPMMMPNRSTVPPGYVNQSAQGMAMPMGPSMYGNGSFPHNFNSSSPHQPIQKSEKDCVHPYKGDKSNENAGHANTPSTDGSFNYNYSQFGAAPGMNCGWPVNAFPPAWNYSSPPNQVYSQNFNQCVDSQFSNQDYSQGYYQNYDHGYNQHHGGNYEQYYNQGQPFMENDYYNVKQENTDVKPNLNKNGPKNKKNEKFQKMRTHYCDTCDRSYPSDEALATHISEHKVCGLDECKFTAHPRVVEKHQQMQHFTGLYRRIGSLYTPEDIEKWRKDRKKNYPTPQNVAERRAKLEEMFARGERMGTPNNRGPRNNHQRNGRFQQKQNSRPNRQMSNGDFPECRQPPPNLPAEPPKKWKPIFPPVVLVIKESEERSGVKPFPGTAALRSEGTHSSEKNDVPKLVENVTISTSLSFLSQYGNSSSDDDSDTEEPQNDTTVAEEPAEEKCPSEPTIVETDSNFGENKVDSVQAERESTDKSLTVAAPQLSNSSEKAGYMEEQIRNESSSTDTNEAPTQTQLDPEMSAVEDGEIQKSAPLNNAETHIAESLESTEPPNRASISPTPPGSSSNGSELLKENESKSLSLDSSLEDCVVISRKIDPLIPGKAKSGSVTSSESASFQKSDEKNESKVLSSDSSSEECVVASRGTEPLISSEAKSGTIASNETVSLEKSDEKMNNKEDGEDCSDDSAPEEVPIVRDGCDKESNNYEDVDDTAVGRGGRKRKRQSRQPNKKWKADDEKQNNNQQQQQNKNAERHENNRVPRAHPPVRRAPTLLEKLLSKEICHERNVILQCVRYVVENNFFRNERSKASRQNTNTL